MNPIYGPEHIIRSYAWAVLKANIAGLNESQYGGLMPIVPVSEEPDIEKYGGFHIVYGYNLAHSADLNQMHRGSLTFVVYESDYRKLSQILTILTTAFEQEDESAKNLNDYSTQVTTKFVPGQPAADGNPATIADQPFVGIRFGTVSMNFVEGGTPETAEGGDQSGLLSISFTYFVDYDVKVKLTDIV